MRSRAQTIRTTLAAVLISTVAISTGLVGTASAERTGRTESSARQAPVRLVGNGYGHGHGMSQWGAQKQALAGRTHRQILSFYYPGLRPGSSGGTVRVLITADTTNDVLVLDRPGLRVRSLGNGKTVRLDRPATARRWRLTPKGGARRTTIAWKGARGGWKTLRTVAGQAEIGAGGRPLTLVVPGERRRYRGVLRSAAPTPSSGQRNTVNVLPLDAYLRGVVPREVYTSWQPATLRAQAIAARTYAAFERADYARRYFHVDDTTSSQVYGGADDEVASTDAAIAATRRQVLTVGSAPAFTQFSASNGGWMSAGSRPYLVAKSDPYDDTYRGWTDSIAPAELERAFPAIGAFSRVEVVARDGNGQWDGRVASIRIVGARTSTTISGETFRSAFGLNSTWFDIT